MKVEIWSDVVCPWCYIGKRRFEFALAQFAHRDEVQVVWRSFELDPGAPQQSDAPLNELLARKIGRSAEQVDAMQAQLTNLAADEGLAYHLDIARHGNTFDAHRLIHFAAESGRQDAMKERLLKAYFTDGLPVGDIETLVTLATEIGLDADAARTVLEGDAYAHEVRADESRAANFGITGVPFVVLDEMLGVSGAQPPQVFLGALEQAWTETHPLTMVAAAEDGAACEGESCDI